MGLMVNRRSKARLAKATSPPEAAHAYLRGRTIIANSLPVDTYALITDQQFCTDQAL